MRRLRWILAVVAAAALAACGSDKTPAAAPPAGPPSFSVMTQNLYLGADLDLLLAGGASLPDTVEQLWANVEATDFPSRAQVMAATIQSADPDVVALQEVSLWRTQTPGDHSPVPNATTVAFDFLQILLDALSAKGLSYRVVGVVTHADIELPGSSGNDYRLTDRDAIIAKESLPITGAGSGTFPHLATVSIPSPVPGAPPLQATIPRGWVAAELHAGGQTIRIFDTHLEAFSPEVATTQVSDLLAVANPGAGPTLIVGDMNLPPGTAGYERYLAPDTRLADAWAVVHDGDAGLTCCWSPDLRGGSLATRIDLLFATPELRATRADRLEDGVRTPGGLSPSDHLGVVVGFDAAAAATTG
jgi:endonuclease/exonuclease/phosphatase family metal-dependent hydrolase